MKNPMDYGKAKGIVLLKKYLPQITPFQRIDLISTIDEWNNIKNKYGKFVASRVDMPIGNARQNAVKGTSGLPESIPGLIKIVNSQNNDGVVLVMETKKQAIPRYEYDGGFNISFNRGENIIIEIVGKGFDGHELTQGLAVHERYQISWSEVLFIRDRKDLLKSKAVLKYCVSAENYMRQRKERIRFLIDVCHYNIDKVEKNIPEKYQMVDGNIIRSMLHDVILELMKKQEMLKQDGLSRFGIQGNIVDGRVEPWEIFRAERWITKDVDMER